MFSYGVVYIQKRVFKDRGMTAYEISINQISEYVDSKEVVFRDCNEIWIVNTPEHLILKTEKLNVPCVVNDIIYCKECDYNNSLI